MENKDKNKAISLYKTGLNCREIKDKLGLTVGVGLVQRWMRKAGISRGPGPPKYLEEQKQRLRYER